MKTAIELADVIDNSEETTGFERRCAAMLRTQAAEIESLRETLQDANHKRKLALQSVIELTKERDALSAERDGLLTAISERDSILRQYSAAHAAKVEKS